MCSRSHGSWRTSREPRRIRRPRAFHCTSTVEPTLRNVIEKRGLNIHERRRLSRRTGQYDGGADLVCTLNQADGKPGAQSHNRAAPILAGARILEAKGLKIISWIIEKTLCPQVIQIQTPGTGQAEKGRHASIKAAHARDRLRGRRPPSCAEKHDRAGHEHDTESSEKKFMTDEHEAIIVWPTIVVDQRGHP